MLRVGLVKEARTAIKENFMFKSLVIIVLLTIATPSISQHPNSNSLKVLSSRITQGITEPKKKLDAIFYWVTDNIAYDVALYNKSLEGRYMYEDFNLNYQDSIEYNEQVAAIVVNRRKGVCDGYARLFKSLCNHARIQCEVVGGRVKSPLSKDLSAHAWNAVRLSGKWYLVDPTWASGQVSDTFTKKLDMFYYLTPPEKLFFDHFPDEQKWTLLDKSFDFEKFTDSPIADGRVIQNGLIDYYPKSKTIKLQQGNPTTIWLLFDKSPSDLSVEISAKGWTETRASRLNIALTDKVYDSLYAIDPDYFKAIEEIQILSKKIIQNKIEFVILPLTDIEGIQIHVDFGFPALIYETANTRNVK
jgi:hypothetical protein